MKCQIPQISWHSRDPVLSVDFQPIQGDQYRLASGGTDSHVLIWYVTYQENKTVKIECASDLYRHNKSVNVVRFSPNGESLASGDDEGAMFIWQLKEREQTDAPKDDENVNKEEWYPMKLLRGHLEDIYDVSWSKDGNFLVSASMDNTAIMWDMQKYVKIHIFSDFKGYVQGVSWDPCNQFIASLGSDRTLRIHNISSKKTVCRISKAPWTNATEKGNSKPKLFYDDTLKSYCRRLTYTPDGELLIVPSGILEKGEKPQNTCYIFSKHSPSKPVISLPTGDWYTIAVRCNPFLYKLRGTLPEASDKENDVPKTMIDLPYRMIFAVAACDSVLMYDTEQLLPFACISKLHYTHLSDLAWSPDGLTLVASSTDGYCSFIVFTREELGEIYVCEEPKENESEKVSDTCKTEKKDITTNSEAVVVPETLKDMPVTPKVTSTLSSKNPKDLSQNANDGSLTPSSKIVNATDKKSDKTPKVSSIKKFFVSPKTLVSTTPSAKRNKMLETSITDISITYVSTTTEPEVIDLSETPEKSDKPSVVTLLEMSKPPISEINEIIPMDVDKSCPVKNDVKASTVEKQAKCKVRLDFTDKVEPESVSAKKSPKTSIKKFFMSPKPVVSAKAILKTSKTSPSSENDPFKKVFNHSPDKKISDNSESVNDAVTATSTIKNENSELLISTTAKESSMDIDSAGREIEFSFGKGKTSTISKSNVTVDISSKIEPVIIIEENASDGDNTSTSICDMKSNNENDWKLELSQDEEIVPMEVTPATSVVKPEPTKSADSKEAAPKRRIAFVTLSSKATLNK